jgi:hypothetical protein
MRTRIDAGELHRIAVIVRGSKSSWCSRSSSSSSGSSSIYEQQEERLD